jgi:hypothetical protein
MGRLVTLLTPSIQDDDELLDDLKAALETRNRLAHRFFREHDSNFMSISGREVMLAELIVARDEFEQVDARLEPVLDRFFASTGVDRETRVRHAKELFDQMAATARAADDSDTT